MSEYVRQADVFLLFDGDSWCNKPDPPNNIPTIVAAALGHAQWNQGTNAITTTQKLAQAALYTSSYASSGTRTVHHQSLGTNDLSFSVPAATIYANKAALALRAKAAGFDFTVTHTICPFTGITGGQEIIRDAANAALLLDASNAFDLVIDLTVDASFEDPTSSYWNVDGLHLFPTGARAYRDNYAVPQIEAMLA